MKRNVSLQYLHCFYVVADCGSFTKAAQLLHLTQSAVSKQITALEQSLGSSMFIRRSRGIDLTADGRLLFNSIAPLMDNVLNVIQSIERQHHHEHVLKIISTQAVAQYWLSPLIFRFNAVYPHIKVHMVGRNDVDVDLLDEHDIGILYGDGNWPRLHQHFLFRERLFPICHRDYDISDVHSIDDLMRHKLIQLDPAQGTWLQWHSWMKLHHTEYRPQFETLLYNQPTLALSACLNRQGIALSWEFMCRPFIDDGILKAIDWLALETEQADYLVYSKVKPLPPAATLFRDWLLNELHLQAASAREVQA
ncbi:LysR family transcriptional regulator [Vitreoscilla massiliensis]|uniref:LysR family transcriptional regulator n=1 Tax=Vitreoscilla massiliensis TaxID=1689272 RepID=A0ABY4E1L1_9NEIS|nr:LysR family transcriptional regulator [Vitreoscilla massiliensis]UOO89665.1 LysR family transcriptional regulator [Vitreoscilla massiliensis]